MAFFSIIIPVYNTEPYLAACVNSVLSQTYSNFEVILVDDGSPDHSAEICDAFAAADSRVSVIHQTNAGLSGARNSGIQYAKGDFLLFLDSDDFWMDTNMLRYINDYLEKESVDVLGFASQKLVLNDSEPTSFPLSTNFSPVFERHTISELIETSRWPACAWNKVIRRKLFSDHDLSFVVGVTSEDIDWTLRLALAARTFAYTAEPFYGYRQRANSISNSMTPKKVKILQSNVEACKKILSSVSSEARSVYMPYLSFQYATLLMNISFLEDRAVRCSFAKEAHADKELLALSKSPKVRLVHYAERILGFSGMMRLLRTRAILQQRKKDIA